MPIAIGPRAIGDALKRAGAVLVARPGQLVPAIMYPSDGAPRGIGAAEVLRARLDGRRAAVRSNNGRS